MHANASLEENSKVSVHGGSYMLMSVREWTFSNVDFLSRIYDALVNA